jgi:LmbE family N-acetylglucosaminyl deacetylase
MMNLERTLVIAPHPDDDVIGAGGLIQRALSTGGQVHVVFVTDGENNPWPQRWMHRKWTITAADRAEFGALRRDEAHDSLTCLAVTSAATTFLGLPDQGVGKLIRGGDTRLLQALRKIIVEFNPTLIVSPSSRDLHNDHRAIAWCAHVAAAGEVPITTYMVHGEGDDRRVSMRIELSESEQRRKRAAIECHESQLLLSRDRFLSHVQPTESFYSAEYDLIAVESASRARFGALLHALHVVFSSYPVVEPPAIDRPAEPTPSTIGPPSA